MSSSERVHSEKVPKIKETKRGFFYTFPPNTYYIIRGSDGFSHLQDGDYMHLYPAKNGELPDGFPSREAAEVYMNKLLLTFPELKGSIKVVDGVEAMKYEVPKRW